MRDDEFYATNLVRLFTLKGKPFTAETISIFTQEFLQLKVSREKFVEVAEAILRDQKIKGIELQITDFLNYFESPIDEKIESEWKNVFRLLKTRNLIRCVDVDFSDAGSLALQSIGGASAVGDSDEKDLHWIKKRFFDAYRDYAKNNSTEIEKAPQIKSGKFGKKLLNEMNL